MVSIFEKPECSPKTLYLIDIQPVQPLNILTASDEIDNFVSLKIICNENTS